MNTAKRRVAIGIEITREQLGDLLDLMDAKAMLTIDNIHANNTRGDDDTWTARVELVVWEIIT